MRNTTETNTKVLSQELFLGVVALTPKQKNHYMWEMGPFPGTVTYYISPQAEGETGFI